MKNNSSPIVKPSCLTICSGMGLVDIALHQAGYKSKGAIDIRELAEESFRKNFSDVPFLRASIRKLSAKMICKAFGIKPGELDLIEISSPCIGFSSTGSYEQFHSANELMFVAMFLALQLRPKVIVFENVPAQTWKGMEIVFSILCHFFKKLEKDYVIEAKILNSNSYGSAQSRSRAFYQCVRRDVGCPKWPEELKDAPVIRDVLPDIDYVVNRNYGDRVYLRDEPAPTITAHPSITIGQDGTERGIKPREAAKLMGVPDTFELVGPDQEQLLGLGNGVAVEVMRALALTIKHDVLGLPQK